MKPVGCYPLELEPEDCRFHLFHCSCNRSQVIVKSSVPKSIVATRYLFSPTRQHATLLDSIVGICQSCKIQH